MRFPLSALALVTLAAACSRESVYFVPGENAPARSDASAPTPETRKRTIVTVPGASSADTTIELADLGVDVPPGAELKEVKSPIARITTPDGERVAASLVTTDGPDAIVAFYEHRHTLSMKTVALDAASMSATLRDGRVLDVSVGSLRNGRRDLVVAVTKSTR